MAHEITRTNGKHEMAFVGATPWHGLGQRVQQGASIAEWAKAAGMEWDARRAVVQYNIGDDTVDGLRMRRSEDDHVIYRSDTGAKIGLVGKDYKIVQPAQVLEFFRDLTEAGDWHIHTAGTLRRGSRLWALASNHTEAEAVPGDRVRGNLLLATSMDGSLKTIAAMTAIRVVCANTLRLALDGLPGAKAGGKVAGKTKDSIAIGHRSVWDGDAVKKELGVARDSFHSFMAQARAMADKPIGTEEATLLLRELFGKPLALVSDEPVRTSGGSIDGSEFAQLLARPALATADDKAPKEHRNIPKVLELFDGKGRGANHEGVHGTRWGLFNAVTEFIDHQSGRNADNRLTGAWFGKGHAMKTEALRLLTDGTYIPAAV